MSVRRCHLPPVGAAADAARHHRASVPVIETARLRLRAADLDDYALWSEINGGPDGEFLGGPFSEADTYADFCVYVAGWMIHGHGLWAVETHDGALLGFVTFGLEWDDDEPELGYLFADHARGKGYATEAARAALDFALKMHGEGGVVSYISAANTTSIALAKRLGAHRDRATEAATITDDTQVWRHGDRT